MDAMCCHHCCRWTSTNSINHKINKNILISTLIKQIKQNPSTAALEQTRARPPAPWVAWYHQIHAAGGTSDSITMVVVFVGCLCCCGLTSEVTSSSYVKNGTKKNPTEGLCGVTFCPTLACTTPFWFRI